jgi:PleD family two-component response regulator
VSIGITDMQPGDTRFDQLLARADAALYGAKASGRDQVAVAPVNGNSGEISG